ncbi:MAG: CRISPR-associated endonuclease Cas1, partial [Planctomycetaceae bacterium]|nr:CRISPR-associated endonuclease Cas1 [Planctomycetaceae bacterium]
MKTHLNTLFVTTQGAYLSKDGAAAAVRVQKETKLRIPLHNLDGIVCFGRVGLSPQLMAACAEAGVSVSLLSESGRFRAAIVGFTPGNVLLRRQQYRAADDEKTSIAITRTIVLAKIANCRTVVLRAARDTADTADAARAESLARGAKRLAATVPEIQQATTIDQLRGLEGEAATTYFASFNQLVTADGDTFRY